MEGYFHRNLITGELLVPELDPSEYFDHAGYVGNVGYWGKARYVAVNNSYNVCLYQHYCGFISASVKMTLFRILNVVVLLCFGIPKAVLSYLGYSVAPTTLETTMGTCLAVMCVMIAGSTSTKF